MNAEESTFLTSDYTIKLQSSKPYGIGGKKKRNVKQWNKTESPETNPCTYGHILFEKGGKTIQWRKDRLFSKWYCENWRAMCKRMKL